MPSLNRRSFLAALASSSLGSSLWSRDKRSSTSGSPQLGDPIPIANSHGDTWAPAWASDSNLYSPSDDTYGFDKATDSNVAFNRLSGKEATGLRGTTVNPMSDYGRSALAGPDGCTWKSSGCAFIDGALYLVVARHTYGETSGDRNRRQTAANASIIRSADFGRTWLRTAGENMQSPMFPGSSFATPYFIQHASVAFRPSQHDAYVYAISNNGFWDNGDFMVLGRVARNKIQHLRGEDWEYFAGGNGFKNSAWVRDAASARPVLENFGKLGMTGAVYVPAVNRYIMIGWYYPAGGGKIQGAAVETVWDFYESPAPWGPWTRTGSQNFKPQGYYSPQICPRFLSPNRSYVWTAGNWQDPRYYRLTLLPVTFG